MPHIPNIPIETRQAMQQGDGVISQERQVAEEKLRVQAQKAIEAEKARAKQEFEQKELAKAQTEFEKHLVTKKAQATKQFERELASEKAKLRTQYYSQRKAAEARFGRLLPAAKQAYKREYATRTGRQPTPKQVAAFFAGDVAAYRSGRAASKEVFEKKLSEWEAGEKAGYKTYKETTLVAWETTERKQFEAFKETETKRFETDILAGWEVTETKKAEQVISEQMKQWKPKGIAERMLDISPEVTHIPTGMDVLREQLFGIKPPVKKKVLALPAGFVASFESVAYSVGTLIGVEGLPAPPPTFAGEAMGSFLRETGKATGAWTYHPEPQKMDPAYAMGSIIGDIALVLIAQKAVGVAAKPVKHVVGKVTAPIKSAYRGSAIDKYLYGRSSLYVSKTGGLPKGIVSIPKATASKALGLTELKYAETARAAFDLTGATGMTGFIPYPTAYDLAKAARSTMGVRILKPWVKTAVPTMTIVSGKVSVKGTMRGVEAFLKSTRATTSIPSLLEVPKKTLAVLPKLAILPEIGIRAAAAYPRMFESIAFTTIMGIRVSPKAPVKPRLDIKAISGVATKMKVSIKQIPVQTTIQVSKQAMKQTTMQLSDLRTMLEVPMAPPSQITTLLPPTRRREEEKLKRKKRKRKTDLIGFRAGILKYELKGMKELAKTILSK